MRSQLTPTVDQSINDLPEVNDDLPQDSHSDSYQSDSYCALDQYLELDIVHRPRWYAWIIGILALIGVGYFLHSLFTNPAWDWGHVPGYLFSKTVLHALLVTVELTFLAAVVGALGGVLISVIRQQNLPILTPLVHAYVWLMRSVPALVQLLFWFNLGYLYPSLSVGIPFGPQLLSIDTNNALSGLASAVIGLGLIEAAFFSEVVRAGLHSVPQGQILAAQALGIPRVWQYSRIIFPQALRSIIPNAVNEIIGLLKTTSLASVIAIPEIFYTAQVIYGRTGRVIPLLMVVVFWYLVLTLVLSFVQRLLEQRLSRPYGQ